MHSILLYDKQLVPIYAAADKVPQGDRMMNVVHCRLCGFVLYTLVNIFYIHMSTHTFKKGIFFKCQKR